MKTKKRIEKIIICYIPCPNRKEARDIAQVLLENKLIACANFLPIKSVYFWPPKSKKLVAGREVVLMAKTKKKNFSKIEKVVKKEHTYDVPCIISWDIGNINKEYLDWLLSEIK